MTDDTCCYLCEGTEETIVHVLFDCGLAKEVWLKLLFYDDVRSFFELELDDWLMSNI